MRPRAFTGQMTPLWVPGPSVAASTPFDAGAHYDVVIVGAGVTGLCTGLMLARLGRSVVVVDQGEVAHLASGSNTGKVSALQGSVLSTLRRGHPASLVRAYADANLAGVEWMRDAADESGVSWSRRTAYSYASGRSGVDAVVAEHDAAREAGLAVRMVDSSAAIDLGFPFPFAGAVALDDQMAVDPRALAEGLARSFVAAGGVLHTRTRVTGVKLIPRPRITTRSGELYGDHIVLATGTPIIDRGLTFAKVKGVRSSCIAIRTDIPAPDGMFLSVDGPTRSIRPVSGQDGPADRADLVVGGAGHPVGRAGSSRALLAELAEWTHEHIPDALEVGSWSAQDYVSHNLVPFVGALPRGFGRIRFATGYGKWGLSNAPAAAMRLTAEITGVPWRERPTWMQAIATRLTVPADLVRGATEGAGVASEFAEGWLAAQRTATPVPQPREGEGIVAHRGVAPVGVSTVDGKTRAVSAVCPHLGGVLSWNDAECTWDCPLHASRFAADGTRIEGPARDDLAVPAASSTGAVGGGADR